MESAKSNKEINQYPIINCIGSNEYDIFAIKTNKNILIKYLLYETELDINDLALLSNKKYKTIEEYFAYFDSIFLKKNVKLGGYSRYKIKLIIDYQKKVEIPLFKRKDYNNYIIEKIFDKNDDLNSEINDLNSKIYELKRENELLRNQIKNIKSDFEKLRAEHRKDIENLKMQIKSLFQQQMNPMMNNFGCLNNLNNQNIITIIFKLTNSKKTIYVQSFSNDTFSSLINKFYLEYGKEKKNKKIDFLFNGRKLPLDSNDTLANLGILNLSNILVLETSYQNPDGHIIMRYGSPSCSNHTYIDFYQNELVSDLIERCRRYFSMLNIPSKKKKFIFNARDLYKKLSQTCEEVGIVKDTNIFVIEIEIDILFKISYKEELFCPLNIKIRPSNSVSSLIELYLTKTNIKRKDIEYFTSNSQKVKEDLAIEEINLENKFEILAISKKRFDTIFINFRFYNKESNIARIECLKSYLISTLIEQFNETTKLNLDEEYFIYNGKELNKNKNVEEAGLKDNDIVFIKKFKFIKD